MGSRLPGLLLLLLADLLLFWRCVRGESSFIIDTVGLTVQPRNQVQSGTPVIIRCQVSVSFSNISHLLHHFEITQDGVPIHVSDTTEDSVSYGLNPARAADSGSYECRVTVKDKSKASYSQKLDVSGLQTPTLQLNNVSPYENEEFKASCSAPEEKGPLIFSFYQRFMGGEPLRIKRVSRTGNSSEIALSLKHIGDCFLSCDYEIPLVSGTRRSNSSKEIQVLVQVLHITPVMNILPSSTVLEGEVVEVHCRVVNSFPRNVELFLLWKKHILREQKGSALVHRFKTQADNSGELICKAQWGNVQKESYKTLTVKEIFSKPKLSVQPTELFEGDNFVLRCIISVYLPDKMEVNRTQYIYYKDGKKLNSSETYSSVGHPKNNGNYSCEAWVYSPLVDQLFKSSQSLLITAKVLVSQPVLSVVGGTLWLGKPFQLLCHSDKGTLPITYVLFGPDNLPEHRVVSESGEKAIFNLPPISKSSDLNSFLCHARNGQHKPPMISSGEHLRHSTLVIEPVSKPLLTTHPNTGSISEGQTLSLVCSVQRGSPPINFTWYHMETGSVLASLSTNKPESSHSIHDVKAKHGGRYYCESTNAADEIKRSTFVQIAVNWAVWKKALIVIFCLLLLLTVILMVAFKKRLLCKKKRSMSIGNKLSVRTASTKPERLSLTQTEVAVANATPSMMGKSVWSDHVSGSESDDQNSSITHEKQETQYTEVQTRDPDPNRAPVKQGTDTVYSQVRLSQQGVPEVVDGVSVEYAQLNHDNGQHCDNSNNGDHCTDTDHVAEADNSVSVNTGDQDGGACDSPPDC
uniref:Platelet endothelial cell adhesion molecule n=1 Tax=Nothobranchius pienaari TaxID=704102 RepID=A0A1A8MZW8_9TELE